MNSARALLERLSLTQQAWLMGLFATASAAAGWAWWEAMLSESAPAPAPGWWAIGGAGALATAAATWAAARARRAHHSLGAAARAITREITREMTREMTRETMRETMRDPNREAPGETVREAAPVEPAVLPLHTESADLLDTTAALRRAVEALRQQIDSLTAQNAALAARLSHRTLERDSLQDLSIGLARKGNDIAGLVDEALHALERTMSYSSASVWARTDFDPAQSVMLLGYRSSATELTGLALADLAGLRLSRANLQRYEQVESAVEPIIENDPQQGLLAWLWAMVTDDARTSALYRGTRSWMAVPLAVRDSLRERVLGVLRVDHAEPGHFDAERSRLLSAVASQTALAMRQAHLSVRERDHAVAAERNRLARDLHDAVSQTLFAANLIAGTLHKNPALPDALRGQSETLLRLNQGALAEMRMLMFELRPDALASLPLADLLQQAATALAARGEIDVQVQVDPVDPPLPMRIELYRMAQEALSNVARHSSARQVHIQWQVDVAHPDAPSGRLVVRDDGRGFDADATHPGHFGLTNMKERAALLGSALQVQSAPGAGTTVTVDLRWSATTPA